MVNAQKNQSKQDQIQVKLLAQTAKSIKQREYILVHNNDKFLVATKNFRSLAYFLVLIG